MPRDIVDGMPMGEVLAESVREAMQTSNEAKAAKARHFLQVAAPDIADELWRLGACSQLALVSNSPNGDFLKWTAPKSPPEVPEKTHFYRKISPALEML
jgi:hypothetical protein